MMKLYVAGGCSEHGRNSFLVSGEHTTVLVDAGKMKEKPDKPFPELSEEVVRKIDYLFLTHSHTDHTGAIGFLKKLGFRGKIVASSATLNLIPELKGYETIALKDRAVPGEEFFLEEDLAVTWGRAGHCVGSVWYSIRAEGRTVLFTGDYEEHSLAYDCDAIRGRRADLAVVDCAYGYEKEDAAEHWEALGAALDNLVHTDRPLLFPVPSHGRGFDVIRLLAERGVETVLTESLIREYQDSTNREFWLKESFTDAVKKLKKRDIQDFRREFEAAIAEGKPFPESCRDTAILVRDSQLVKEANRHIAVGVEAMGGRTILTGKQDPASFARKLFNDGAADFFRISVHQNIEEMRRLAGRNHFKKIVPYHCREQLTFPEKEIMVLEPGDSVEI